MNEKSKTLRRLGVAGVGAAIAIGTPAVGFTGIASAANPAALTIVSQANGAASTLNDGTNSTVKVSAVESQLPSGTGNPDIASVRFDYTLTSGAGGTITPIATDTTAPFSVEWTPPASGTYTLTAEPLASGGGSAGTPTTQTGVVVDNSSPTVHLNSPSDGDTVPFYSSDGASSIGVTGTRSITGGLPAVSIQTQLRDDSTTSGDYGLLDDAINTNAAVPAVAAPLAGASQHWSAVVQVPTDCPTGDTCDVITRAIAGATVNAAGATDEVTQATLAATAQHVDGFTVTPTGTTNGTSGVATQYTVTATDGGAPVAGVTVVASSNHASTTTITPPAGNAAGDAGEATTGVDGTATFSVTDTANETSTLSFSTEFNSTSVVPGTDFTVTRTLVTTAPVTPVLTTVTLTKNPSQSAYASQSYSASYPKILACAKDQTGAPFTGAFNPIVTVNRSTGVNVTGTIGDETTPTSGCYPVSASSYPVDSATGNDLYTVYVDKNGTPGFQAGSDIGDTTTVNFAPGVITFDSYKDCTNNDCDTQAQEGVVDTITAGELVGGSAIPAGATLDLTLSGAANANFPATQPAGATRLSNTTATCTTDASGTCKVNVADGFTETATLSATDGQGLSGAIAVHFRNHSVAFKQVELENNGTLYPESDGPNPDNSFTEIAEYGTPGTVMVDTYQVEDSAGSSLADVPVTLSVDHGFFTPVPSDTEDYNTATFDPAAAAGAKVGSLKSLGKSITATTDDNGEVTFALSIGADSGFNVNGHVATDVSIASGGTTVDGGNPADGEVGEAGDYTWTTNTNDFVGGCEFVNAAQKKADKANAVRPNQPCDADLGELVEGGALNGTSVKISPVSGESFTGNHTDDTSFYVQLTDQFGNEVGSSTSVTETGAGNGDLRCNTLFSSYDGQVAANDEDTCDISSSENSPTVAAADTVTDTWTTQTTTFTANTPANVTAGDPAFVATVDAGLTNEPTKSDSFTIDLYSVDLTKLNYASSVDPGKVVKTGTTVHDEITVTDQYNNPVEGLFVTFDQSGPGAGVDTKTSDFTNASGVASDNFSSSDQGNATVTTDVYEHCFAFDGEDSGDCTGTGGVPLSENVSTVGFDGVPTIDATTPTKGGKVTISGVTRPGASVQLFAKVSGGGTKTVGSPQTAQSDGSYSFTESISKTTTYSVQVDSLQISAAKTVSFKAPKISEKPKLKLSSHKKGELKAKATTDPSISGATVHFYEVSNNGDKASLGKDTTNSNGVASTTFDLKAGKSYTLVAKVTGLGKKYDSQYSNEKSKTVKG